MCVGVCSISHLHTCRCVVHVYMYVSLHVELCRPPPKHNTYLQPPNQHKHTCTHSTTQLSCPVSRLLQKESVMVTSTLSDTFVPSHSPSNPYMCSYMLCLCLLVDLCRKPILPPPPFPPTQHIPIHTHKHTDMLACMWTH